MSLIILSASMLIGQFVYRPDIPQNAENPWQRHDLFDEKNPSTLQNPYNPDKLPLVPDHCHGPSPLVP